jgi:hypothetical protein
MTETESKVINTTLVWLDDVRDPFENDGEWLVFAPMRANEVIWVKNYDEFVAWITENGLPDGIAFDHDLADEHYAPREHWDEKYHPWAEFQNFKEKTGMDCAHWLVEYCMDNEVKLPIFGSHSANPPGRKNILDLLNNFKNHQDV